MNAVALFSSNWPLSSRWKLMRCQLREPLNEEIFAKVQIKQEIETQK